MPLPLWEGTQAQYDVGVPTTWYNYQYVEDLSWQNMQPFCPDSQNMYNLCYGNGKFLQTHIDGDYDTYKLYQSSDGINWSTPQTNLPRAFGDPFFVNGKFFLTSNAEIFISEDGINWSDTSYFVVDGNSSGFAYGNNIYVAIAMNGNRIAHSSDGMEWSSVEIGSVPSSGYLNFKNIIFAGNEFFVLTNSGTVLHSSDGINWSSINLPLTPTTSLVYGNGIFLALENNRGSGYVNCVYSSDGINWETGSCPEEIFPFEQNYYSNDLLIFADGNFYTTNAYSPDGINWQYLNTEGAPSLMVQNEGYLVYGAGKILFEAKGWSDSSFAYLQLPQSGEEPDPCYLSTSEPTTSSTVYSEPEVESALTIISVESRAIRLSDGNKYEYNPSGDQTTYASIATNHPDWICNIKGVGVKIGNTMIAEVNDAELKSRVSTLESRLEALEAQLNNS